MVVFFAFTSDFSVVIFYLGCSFLSFSLTASGLIFYVLTFLPYFAFCSPYICVTFIFTSLIRRACRRAALSLFVANWFPAQDAKHRSASSAAKLPESARASYELPQQLM
jgi:hypothetical protein